GGSTPGRRGPFGLRLREPENVVDEEQNVLPFFVAEILRNRQARQAHSQPGAGRLRHLPVDQRALRFMEIAWIDDTRFLHFEPQIVSFARPLADTREYRHAAVLHGDVVDQLHDNDSLADTRAAKQADLAAGQIRLEQVDDLDARFEHLQLGRLLFERRRRAVNRILLVGVHGAHLVHGLADYVQHTSQHFLADRHLDGRARADGLHATHQAFRG